MGKCQSQESARDYAASDKSAVAAQPLQSVTKQSHAIVEEAVAIEKPSVTKQTLPEMPENAIELDENEQSQISSQLPVENPAAQESAASQQDEKEEEMEIKSQALTVIKQVIQEGCQKIAVQPNVPTVIETEPQVLDDVVVVPDEKVEEVKPSGEDIPILNDMNITEASARDYAASDETTVATQPSAKTFAIVEQPSVAVEKLSITEQTLLEMPEHAIELDENEHINIFSKLLVKNLIVNTCIVQESVAQELDVIDRDEEVEIKSQAVAVIKQVIQEGCQEIAGQSNVPVVVDEKEDDMEIKSQALAVIEQLIQEGCQKIAGQPNVALVVETKAQDSDDVVVIPDGGVEEVELAGKDIPITNDMNVTESKAVAAPCPKCKGTGKINLMGGARGLSFMKRQCKYCSSGTAAQAAKGGA